MGRAVRRANLPARQTAELEATLKRELHEERTREIGTRKEWKNALEAATDEPARIKIAKN